MRRATDVRYCCAGLLTALGLETSTSGENENEGGMPCAFWPPAHVIDGGSGGTRWFWSDMVVARQLRTFAQGQRFVRVYLVVPAP
jgi:hypothetical protein